MQLPRQSDPGVLALWGSETISAEELPRVIRGVESTLLSSFVLFHKHWHPIDHLQYHPTPLDILTTIAIMANFERLIITFLLVLTAGFLFMAQTAEAAKGPKITHKVCSSDRECKSA